ncbi:MAG: hypothetical protein ACOX2F_09220 [bacterium]
MTFPPAPYLKARGVISSPSPTHPDHFVVTPLFEKRGVKYTVSPSFSREGD